jgi:hypothetical protein
MANSGETRYERISTKPIIHYRSQTRWTHVCPISLDIIEASLAIIVYVYNLPTIGHRNFIRPKRKLTLGVLENKVATIFIFKWANRH